MQYKEAISIQLARCNDSYTDALYQPLRCFIALQTTQKSEVLRNAAQQSKMISYCRVLTKQQRIQMGKNILIPKTLKLKKAQDLSKIWVQSNAVYHTIGVTEKQLPAISQLQLESKLKNKPTEELFIAYQYGSQYKNQSQSSRTYKQQNHNNLKMSLSDMKANQRIVQSRSKQKSKYVKFPLTNLQGLNIQEYVEKKQSQTFKEHKSLQKFPMSLLSPTNNKQQLSAKNNAKISPISLASLASGTNMPDAITCKAPPHHYGKQYFEGIFTTRASATSPITPRENINNKTTNLVFQSQTQTKNSSVQFYSTNQKRIYDEISQSPSAQKSWYNLLSKFQGISEDRISQISSILQDTQNQHKSNQANKNAEVNNYSKAKYKYNLFSILDATTNNLIEQVPGAGDKLLLCGPTECIAQKPKRNNWGASQTSIESILGQLKKQCSNIQMKILEEIEALQESQDTDESESENTNSSQEIGCVNQNINITF